MLLSFQPDWSIRIEIFEVIIKTKFSIACEKYKSDWTYFKNTVNEMPDGNEIDI